MSYTTNTRRAIESYIIGKVWSETRIQVAGHLVIHHGSDGGRFMVVRDSIGRLYQISEGMHKMHTVSDFEPSEDLLHLFKGRPVAEQALAVTLAAGYAVDLHGGDGELTKDATFNDAIYELADCADPVTLSYRKPKARKNYTGWFLACLFDLDADDTVIDYSESATTADLFNKALAINTDGQLDEKEPDSLAEPRQEHFVPSDTDRVTQCPGKRLEGMPPALAAPYGGDKQAMLGAALASEYSARILTAGVRFAVGLVKSHPYSLERERLVREFYKEYGLAMTGRPIVHTTYAWEDGLTCAASFPLPLVDAINKAGHWRCGAPGTNCAPYLKTAAWGYASWGTMIRIIHILAGRPDAKIY